jgi:hypothetical protein
MGMEGDQGRQPVGGMGPLNDCVNERLMSSMYAIECANGQNCFLPEIGLGQVIDYVHIAAVLDASTVRMPFQEAKTFFGHQLPEEARYSRIAKKPPSRL